MFDYFSFSLNFSFLSNLSFVPNINSSLRILTHNVSNSYAFI